MSLLSEESVKYFLQIQDEMLKCIYSETARTGSHPDRKRDRQTDRQTETETHTETHRERRRETTGTGTTDRSTERHERCIIFWSSFI